jgi:hypothetical protein
MKHLLFKVTRSYRGKVNFYGNISRGGVRALELKRAFGEGPNSFCLDLYFSLLHFIKINKKEN